MELIDYETERTMTREEAAAELRKLADALSRNNQVQFLMGSLRTTVRVPAEVTLSYEVEVSDDGGEIELEISW